MLMVPFLIPNNINSQNTMPTNVFSKSLVINKNCRQPINFPLISLGNDSSFSLNLGITSGHETGSPAELKGKTT